ncbi:MAG TPA: VOC family protein [Pyrinomonadaceae bacterium]|nr:VOC family protein [Pyrinomonadaceae bacterium]
MKRVTGIGGIFFKSSDPKKLREWYRDHLGIESEGESGASFHWREAEAPNQEGFTVWSAFPDTTKYFDPSAAPFMINYRVANLDWLLGQLHDEGVDVDPRIEEYEYGRFAWIMDPEGNRIELWEPPAPK